MLKDPKVVIKKAAKSAKVVKERVLIKNLVFIHDSNMYTNCLHQKGKTKI